MSRGLTFSISIAIILAIYSLDRADHPVAPVALGGVIGVALALSYCFRGKGPVNAFSFMLLVSGAIVVMGFTVVALSYLTPAGALLLATVMTIAAVILSRRRGLRRERREVAGLCGHCGYDLRATPDRCPECGRGVSEDLARRRRLTAHLRRASPKDGEVAPGDADIAA